MALHGNKISVANSLLFFDLVLIAVIVGIMEFTSDGANALESQLSAFHTLYCSICGNICMVTDHDIAQVPRRKTDRALALLEEGHQVKKYMDSNSDRLCLKRQGGVEVQYRWFCKSCNQCLGYRNAPKEKDAIYFYFYQTTIVAHQMHAARFQDVA